jgi:hypothetical protein
MYSSYEVCITIDCTCDHGRGVWRAEGVSLVNAYRMLTLAPGYASYVVGPTGERRVR